MDWFSTKAQVVQTITPIVAVLIVLIGLFVAAKHGEPAMSSGHFSSAGAVLFYLIMVVVSVFSIFSIWFSSRKLQQAQNQAKLLPVKTNVDPQNAPPAIVFLIQQKYINYTDKKTFPLKLHVIWANAGGEIHLGKPQWVSGKVLHQGHRVGQPLMHRFRTKGEHEKEETDREEVTVKPGQRGELWLALDPEVDVSQARGWMNANQLGVLVLPFSIRGITSEIRLPL